jgi:secreted trypsin-like serine protease
VSRARSALVGVLAAAAFVLAVVPAAVAEGGPTTSVINGQEAGAGTFPYMAFIEFNNGVEGDLCSGTVVSSNVVLTAAHCVLNEEFSVLRSPTYLTVVTGNVNRVSPARTVSAVSAVAVDPNLAWTIPGYLAIRGDAAVLKLASPITAPPIKIATTQTWNTGTGVVLAGWGRTTAFGASPEILRVGEAGIQSPEYCKGKSPHFESAWVLCVQDYPSARYAICHGDSGGPLLTTGPAGEPLEIGIASYVSSEECSPSTPQYFTRADAVASFVSQKVTEWAPPPPVQPTTPTPTPTPTTTTPAPSTPAPKPAPAPITPALPAMTQSLAMTYATRALRLGMGGHFRGRSEYSLKCSNKPTSTQRCNVSWTRGSYYYGTVNLFYLYEGGKLVWNDHYRIHKLENCNPRCSWRLYQG